MKHLGICEYMGVAAVWGVWELKRWVGTRWWGAPLWCLKPTQRRHPVVWWGWMCLRFQVASLYTYIIGYAIIVVLFSPLHSPPPCTPPPTHIPPPFSSCPWVVHISSLASTFPILFLPSPCLFYTYHLCCLFSVPFPPLSPSHSPIDNPPCDLHFCGSVSVLVVCLVCSCFCLRCGC